MNRLAPYALVLVMADATLSAAPAQQPSARTTPHPIEAVHVTGNKRYSVAQVAKVSGLSRRVPSGRNHPRAAAAPAADAWTDSDSRRRREDGEVRYEFRPPEL